jgi:hypothetical protein
MGLKCWGWRVELESGLGGGEAVIIGVRLSCGEGGGRWWLAGWFGWDLVVVSWLVRVRLGCGQLVGSGGAQLWSVGWFGWGSVVVSWLVRVALGCG